ncbi:MAG: cytochrome D ubiquinol oxidase subunit II [Cytophaga sp.]|nr:cytochrome D ubiquinol oxidase subunit II [Cytophaga sp.]
MEYVIIAYLFLSILLYVVLGGADFGAGIIELFTSNKNRSRTRKTLYQAIGPIWEANHMWLIITIVILFVAFPVIYAEMSVYLHIPLIIMLIGIIARGTAFVFRHYDAVKDDMQWVYNRIYILSSFVTPFFLGVIAGSVISGQIDHESKTFADTYVYSWLNLFSLGVGLFVVALCGFLASVYLIGEAESKDDRTRFVNKAKHMNIAAIVSGLIVFIVAVIEEIPLLNWIFDNAVGTTAVIAATLSLITLWYLIGKGKSFIIRPLAAFQVTMILLAIGYAHYPDFIIVRNGTNLSLFDHLAPEKTLAALGWALLLGSFFILPALYYLYYSFNKPLTDD